MKATFRQAIFPLCLLLILLLLLGNAGGNNFIARQGWGLLSLEIITIALALFYWGFERGQITSREIVVIAMLGTIAAVVRIPFAILPGVQPTTFIVIISGFVFGARAGFMVGSTAALVSNLFLGQGPWLPWQMFAWGLAGVSAGVVKAVYPQMNSKGLLPLCFLWGYLFGWLMNLWSWLAFIQPLTWKTFIAYGVASFWFDTSHAVGNAVFCAFFGPSFIKILRRFRRKLVITTVVYATHSKDATIDESEINIK